jgi:hypothetical protein
MPQPKDNAPSILAISKQKNFSVHEALDHEFWIRNTNYDGGILVLHKTKFYTLSANLKRSYIAAAT